MKKNLFILVLSFLLISSADAQAADLISRSECADLKGSCNLAEGTCESNQENKGICTTVVGAIGACCKMKDNGPVDLSYRGISLDDSGTPIIGEQKCKASKERGGWGGACKVGEAISDDGCSDYGNDEEDLVGFCDPPGVWGRGTQCCVAKGTALKNPVSKNFLTIGMSETACGNTFNSDGSGYGGECQDVDSNGWDFTGGALDTKEATCANSDEVIVGLCRKTNGDFDNGCCVPKDGDYCKKLKENNASGEDICSTRGVGGQGTTIGRSDYELLEQIPGSGNTSGKLQPYLEGLYKAGFVLIVLGAIFMIGVGGFTYMASAGNTSMIKKGKGMITDALIGLVVALSIWVILNIINPDLVKLQLDPLPGLSFDPGGTGALIAGSQSIPSLPAKEAAQKLLDHKNITLSNSSSCNNNDGAKDNLTQITQGQGMRKCDGGTVAPNEKLLNSLVALAESGTSFNINFLAGGKHSENSRHYRGLAVDIDPKIPQSQWESILTFFKNAGSSKAFCDKRGKSVACTQASHVHVDFL